MLRAMSWRVRSLCEVEAEVGAGASGVRAYRPGNDVNSSFLTGSRGTARPFLFLAAFADRNARVYGSGGF